MSQQGKLDRFLALLSESLADGSFVRLALSRPTPAAGDMTGIAVRLINLKKGPHLSFTISHPKLDETKNLEITEGIAWLRKLIETSFRSAWLATTGKCWQLFVAENAEATLIPHRSTISTAPPRQHDITPQGILDDSARDWLEGLGIAGHSGKLRADMMDKYRQINCYLNIFSHLAADCGWKPQQTTTNPLRLADMGCGKGYLTFALWHLLRRIWKIQAQILGIEIRPELVERANAVARQIHADGLEFKTGDIATAALPALDGLIALHACNTATDAAILRGLQLRARLIVVAPCCHKEIRPQLKHPEPLAPVLRHGIMAERMSEWVTDGLRALALEAAGYETKLFEFVASEHTPKNLMLAALWKGSEKASAIAARQRQQLKEFFGIQRQALDDAPNFRLEQTAPIHPKTL